MQALDLLRDVLGWVLLVGGGLLVIVGALGLIRMPDMYTRMHAASVTDTLAAGMMLIGMMVMAGFTLITIKLIIILVFILFTSPCASYALGNAALSQGLRPILDEDEGRMNKDKGAGT